MKTNTTTAAKLLEVSRQLGLSLPEVMLRRERELNETPPEVVYEKLRVAYGIMRQAVEESLREPHKTMGGLIGGEARKLAEYGQRAKICAGRPFPGPSAMPWECWRSALRWALLWRRRRPGPLGFCRGCSSPCRSSTA